MDGKREGEKRAQVPPGGCTHDWFKNESSFTVYDVWPVAWIQPVRSNLLLLWMKQVQNEWHKFKFKKLNRTRSVMSQVKPPGDRWAGRGRSSLQETPASCIPLLVICNEMNECPDRFYCDNRRALLKQDSIPIIFLRWHSGVWHCWNIMSLMLLIPVLSFS